MAACLVCRERAPWHTGGQAAASPCATSMGSRVALGAPDADPPLPKRIRPPGSPFWARQSVSTGQLARRGAFAICQFGTSV